MKLSADWVALVALRGLVVPSKNDNRHLIIGGRHRAMSRYCMIKNRVKTASKCKKNKHYAGIQVLVSVDDFIEWFMPLDFAGCSVDRIDKNGNYELENMQVIPLWQNIAKDKLIAKDGKSTCFACDESKDLSDFVKDRRRMTTGRATICIECEKERGRIRVANSHKSEVTV